MSSDTADHRRMAEKAREEINLLKKQVRELVFVERFHLRKAGLPIGASAATSNGSAAKTPRLPSGTMWHDAAKAALKAAGKPAKIGDLADWLVAHGYQKDLSRRRIFNAIYVALKRRKDLFEQVADARWKLKEE